MQKLVIMINVHVQLRKVLMVCFVFFSYSLFSQVSGSYKNDNLSINRDDTIYIIGKTFKHISMRLYHSRHPIASTKYKTCRILGVKKEDENIILVTLPFEGNKNARFYYYIDLFPAIREKEITLK